MEFNYHKSFSRSLGRDMEYKTYGTCGRPMLVFPSQDGRFFDYENWGMINVLAPHIESGRLRVICCDSIDKETWSNEWGDGRQRSEQHERWYHYIVDELIPQVRCGNEQFIVTGCSMGAFHAGNFFFRRPDIFNAVVALSGFYNADLFFHDYHDDIVYNNSPIDFLPNMHPDHHYWDLYSKRRMIFCVGQGNWEGPLLDSTRRLEAVLRSKGASAWFDYWGTDVAHDWDWWRKQLAYFMPHVLG